MSLRNLFSRIRSCTLYIRVHKNRFFIRHIEDGSEVSHTCPDGFSTDEAIISDLSLAEECLSELVEELLGNTLHFLSPRTLIHPTELVGRHISVDDERLLYEVALNATKASYVAVWNGRPLSDEEVLERLEEEN